MQYYYGMVVQGFDPVANEDSRVIILGTLPGGESLRLRQYYADGGNAFWFIVEKLFGIVRSGSYDARKKGLRIAIWDVLQKAERNGSQDNKIVGGTEVPNDFATFFRRHQSIGTVFFNGGRAEQYFRDFVVPQSNLGAGDLRFCPALPSTSGVNTHATPEQKAERWRVVQRALGHPTT